jgi:hypothetical protein
MGRLDGLKEELLRDFVGLAFNHHDGIGSSGHHEVK